jgi:hypothetical protein
MAPRKMTKNIDAVGEGSNPNADILSDTTTRAIDTVKSWTQVFEILKHEVIIVQMILAMKWTILTEINSEL